MNAEVICYKGSWDTVKKVGVSQGRELEKELAKSTYPQITEFQDVTQKAILYTLEDETIDAAIQDLTKAAQISEYSCKPLSEEDTISYVMVVDKEFAETEAFADFVKSYNQAVERLNDTSYLAERLGVTDNWIEEKNIKFLSVDEK